MVKIDTPDATVVAFRLGKAGMEKVALPVRGDSTGVSINHGNVEVTYDFETGWVIVMVDGREVGTIETKNAEVFDPPVGG